MVTIWPSFISCLMTSEALTDILCARSATLMVSGHVHFLHLRSAGATNDARRAVVALAAAAARAARASRHGRRPRAPRGRP